MEIGKEISMPVINKSPDPIAAGRIVYVDKKELHIYLWGKWRKYRWYHRFFKKPAEVGIITGIDTSGFKAGQDLYLDPNNPGGFIAK